MAAGCSGVRNLPDVRTYTDQVGQRKEVSAGLYTMPYGRLHRNDAGLWELYVAGDPLARGLTNGKLTEELLEKQEAAFVGKLAELVPSRSRQRLLHGFLRFFNRRLVKHVPPEYQAEIYGLSQSASHAYDFIAPPYQRLLYFHGAHDIGHALQDLALVGCTSFALWGTHTADGKLLIGRNFDFYAGDAFSEEKMIAFVHPDTGYKHALVTWPGMVGAVSGMNEKGLTVTINAGKSGIPFTARTPISLVAREILQYAATTDDAVRIARQRKVFVSESILVGSAVEREAILIEVSPRKLGVFRVDPEHSLLMCTNHFQSEPYRSDRRNLRQINESHSMYRFNRLHELLSSAPPLTPQRVASVLRNREGIHNAKLGYGNEKAINQLLAHHAVIFQPEDRLMWVSTHPYPLGSFVAYDLTKVFSRMDTLSVDGAVDEGRLRIPEDPFVVSDTFANYERFREQSRNLEASIRSGKQVDESVLHQVVTINPDYWKAYFLVGEYYRKQRRYQEASEYYRMALRKEVTTEPDRRTVEKRVRQCERRR